MLIIGGASIVAASTACYGLVPALWWLVAARIVTGFGEAGVLRRRGDDDHRPLASRPARRGRQLLVGRGVRRARVRARARRARCAATTATRWRGSCRPRSRSPRRCSGSSTREVRARIARARRTSSTAPRCSPGTVLVPRADPARRLQRVRAAVRRGPPRDRLRRDLPALRRADPRCPHLRRPPPRPPRRASRGHDRAGVRRDRHRPHRRVADGRGTRGRHDRLRDRHVVHVSGALAARAAARHRPGPRFGRRDVLVVLRSRQGLGAFICGAVVALTGNRGAFATGAVTARARAAAAGSRGPSRVDRPRRSAPKSRRNSRTMALPAGEAPRELGIASEIEPRSTRSAG